LKPQDIAKIEAYLQRVLNPAIRLATRPRVTDSVEVLIDGEHVAVVYLVEDEGEVSYQLQLTILEEDLEPSA
jgi:hypothetical protein